MHNELFVASQTGSVRLPLVKLRTLLIAAPSLCAANQFSRLAGGEAIKLLPPEK